MQDKDQRNRAKDFRKTLKDIYDDSNTSFNLDSDNECLIVKSRGQRKGYTTKQYLFHRDGTMSAYVNGKYGSSDSPQRTSDRALARKHAKNWIFYGDDNLFNKNNFISECVDKTIDRVMRKFIR